ncbi:hypothetical protein IscW_ISCW002460 [Ixodes scapularis]|uniref:Uncharacterized protein n=1 Tax=Ixodes scapularis TaxID=6945 RepID=B7PAZ2_IXOSC|nr:hypothetical protein IscW_ISCW002460 [Ixodes scapularis]|eukprot:XP_002407481.1 hypothetical protein IscW_ISCW002460 [Ixodes scapularis]
MGARRARVVWGTSTACNLVICPLHRRPALPSDRVGLVKVKLEPMPWNGTGGTP